MRRKISVYEYINLQRKINYINKNYRSFYSLTQNITT